MSTPAYSRLDVDERRRLLLDVGRKVFTDRPFDEVSMNDVARAAGISKGLLYHYFPSKRDFFIATLESAAGELRRLTETDPSLTPLEQLTAAVGAYLGWIEEHEASYVRLIESAGGSSEVRTIVETVREETVGRLIEAASASGEAGALRSALHGWLWFIDGAVLEWLRRRHMSRDQLRELLIAAFGGALMAAKHADPDVELAFS